MTIKYNARCKACSRGAEGGTPAPPQDSAWWVLGCSLGSPEHKKICPQEKM